MNKEQTGTNIISDIIFGVFQKMQEVINPICEQVDKFVKLFEQAGVKLPKIHEIKLSKEFCDDVYSGEKSFEIRYNDRDYQTEDIVQFIPWDCDANCEIDHPIKDKTYVITYTLLSWGILEGYVGFAIKEAVEQADEQPPTPTTVLPCNVGDIVIARFGTAERLKKCIIERITILPNRLVIYAVTENDDGELEGKSFEKEEIGKTVFLVKKLDRWTYGRDMASGEDRAGWI